MTKGSIEWEYTSEDGLVLRLKPAFRHLFSEETRSHIRATRREMLMTVRSLIDLAVQKMDDEKETASQKGRTKIEVQ